MQYILHSEMSRDSREFVQNNALSGFELITWEKQADVYLAKGLPSPTVFPSAVVSLASAYIIPAEGDPYSFPVTLAVISNPASVEDIEVQKQGLEARKQAGEFIGQLLPQSSNVEGFVNSILEDSRTQSLDVFTGMVDGLDKLRSYYGKTTVEFMQLYWAALKHRLSLSVEYIEFVENKAREFHIPIVGLV